MSKLDENPVRVQLVFTKEKFKELELLKGKTGMNTMKSVFDSALTFLSWGVEQQEEGRMVASVDEKSSVMREFVMPALRNAKMKGTKQDESQAEKAKAERP